MEIIMLILILFPLIINRFTHSKLVFIALIGIQLIVFFLLKEPNCYEIGCPEIEKNNERMLYYEKFNTQDSDLNTLRSEQFQQNHLYKALHYQLIIFLIFLSLSNDEKYEKTLNNTLYIILTVFSLEASVLLATELYKIPMNLTYFEVIKLVKIIEISLLLFVREVSQSFFKSNIEILEETVKKQASEENNLSQAIESLKQKPSKSLLSIENTYNVISLSGIVQLFLS